MNFDTLDFDKKIAQLYKETFSQFTPSDDLKEKFKHTESENAQKSTSNERDMK